MKTKAEMLAMAEALEWAVAELLSEREIDDIETRAIELRAQAQATPEPVAHQITGWRVLVNGRWQYNDTEAYPNRAQRDWAEKHGHKWEPFYAVSSAHPPEHTTVDAAMLKAAFYDGYTEREEELRRERVVHDVAEPVARVVTIAQGQNAGKQVQLLRDVPNGTALYTNQSEHTTADAQSSDTGNEMGASNCTTSAVGVPDVAELVYELREARRRLNNLGVTSLSLSDCLRRYDADQTTATMPKGI